MESAVVKITRSISAHLFFNSEGKIKKCSLFKNSESSTHNTPSDPYRLFESYSKADGDPEVPLSLLDLSVVPPDHLKVLLKLKELCPFGRVITYGELARRVGKHPRFIGTVMRKNPFPLIFPCHRVISKNGLGGFSQGMELKLELLRHEGIIL
jgi:methylated-DNA-[protein]-cysteine S-methyltransferase